jgi:hypothetical protein
MSYIYMLYIYAVYLVYIYFVCIYIFRLYMLMCIFVYIHLIYVTVASYCHVFWIVNGRSNDGALVTQSALYDFQEALSSIPRRCILPP